MVAEPAALEAAAVESPLVVDRAVREYHFEVFPDVEGQWRWHLVAANGEIMAGSEGYSRRRDALRSIRGMKVAVAKASVA